MVIFKVTDLFDEMLSSVALSDEDQKRSLGDAVVIMNAAMKNIGDPVGDLHRHVTRDSTGRVILKLDAVQFGALYVMFRLGLETLKFEKVHNNGDGS